MDFEYDVLVVGCGLSGAVIAERFANILNKKVLIIEKRNHIGGNCYDYIDDNTGILISKYGPHYFHTNDENVWKYINQFSKWERYEHKVLANIDDKFVPIPVNITTVNMLCNENIKNEEEMNEWLNQNQIKYENINNGEEMAKSRVGEILYQKIFHNYTFKQWGRYPNELNSEVLSRIPIRNNFDDRYFTDKYQSLPKDGYTKFISKIIDHPNIKILLNANFEKNMIKKNKIVIYTGPIDGYFSQEINEKLEYRSLDLIFETYKMSYYQPAATVNYPGNNCNFTRITEYKYGLNQKSDYTIISKEYSKDEGEPYYPILNEKNLTLYEKYKFLADKEINNNVHFIGRLANYKYFNMDQAIKNSIDYFNQYFNN